MCWFMPNKLNLADEAMKLIPGITDEIKVSYAFWHQEIYLHCSVKAMFFYGDIQLVCIGQNKNAYGNEIPLSKTICYLHFAPPEVPINLLLQCFRKDCFFLVTVYEKEKN